MKKKQKKTEKKIESITKLILKAQARRKQIYEQIMAIPQNKDIAMMSQSVHAFALDSKNLSADMMISPKRALSYFNFKIQCANIVSYLEKQPVEKFEQKLKEMTTANSQGGFILKGQGYAYRLHPEVVKYLKKIL
jgi:ERCC4-related helicase